MGQFLLLKGLGQDPDDLAAGSERRVRHSPHQPDLSAAIDQLQIPFGDQPAHRPGGIEVSRIAAGAGPAKDAHRSHQSLSNRAAIAASTAMRAATPIST